MHRFLRLNEEKLDLLIKVLHDSQYENEREKVIANELWLRMRIGKYILVKYPIREKNKKRRNDY